MMLVELVVKNLSANAGDKRDVGSISGSGRSSELGNGNPPQYSCLGNPLDRGAWQATVHGVTKSETHLSTHTRVQLFLNTENRTGSLCVSCAWLVFRKDHVVFIFCFTNRLE